MTDTESDARSSHHRLIADGGEYLCVTCGELKPGSRFEEGDCTCNDCYDEGRGGVNYTVNENGQVVER